MTLDDYQQQAGRTRSVGGGGLAELKHVCTHAMGLAGEAGEVVDYLKKVYGHGHTLDRGKLAKELGDVLWYVAAVASDHGLLLSDIAEGNIKKLEKRYPLSVRNRGTNNVYVCVRADSLHD